MMGASHRLIGSAAGLTAVAMIAPNSETLVYPMAAIAGGFGSLIPDIDHTSSKAGRAFPPLSWVISKFFAHRGFTHSLLAMAGLYFLIETYASGNILAIAALVGFASHVAADILTKKGVMLFWPVPIWIKVPVISTNSRKEPLLALFLAVVIVCYPYQDAIYGFLTRLV